jgi:hypothetical protein
MRRMPTDQRGGDLTPPLADTLHEMSCDQFHDGLCATPISNGPSRPWWTALVEAFSLCIA